MDARTSNRIDPKTVLGWGVDANPENDPTYPMRDRSHEEKTGSNWLRPPVQNPGVEILQSNEHIRRPAVVGTSTPPRGLSGVIRRAAFVRTARKIMEGSVYVPGSVWSGHEAVRPAKAA